MSEEFLSQEEIDALLGGESETEKKEESKSDIAPFDFSEVEHIKKGGLPGLDMIFERWIKVFREDVRKISADIGMVSKDNMYISRFNAFMMKIPLPASFSIFNMRPLKENALLIIDSRLVFTIVSVLFGGPAKPFKVEGREFTKLETKIVYDFVEIILKTFEEVWESLYPVNIELVSVELNPSLAKIVSPNEKIIVVECSLDISGYEAPFFFIFPQGMFMPIKDIVFSQSPLTEDPVWKKNLTEKILKLELKLTLELLRKEFKVRDILSWDIGSEIVLDITKDDELSLYVENEKKFLAKLGKVDKRYAAMITKILENNSEGKNGREEDRRE
ncbi:MAG: flagellar motor switch protein FliM [Aquificota bacterium]|nr:MAG: flagellar motor switch protein FliM [Aquificota bacterium]